MLRQPEPSESKPGVMDRVMRLRDLEREKGITIWQADSVDYDGIRLNIVDTPGHADLR